MQGPIAGGIIPHDRSVPRNGLKVSWSHDAEEEVARPQLRREADPAFRQADVHRPEVLADGPGPHAGLFQADGAAAGRRDHAGVRRAAARRAAGRPQVGVDRPQRSAGCGRQRRRRTRAGGADQRARAPHAADVPRLHRASAGARDVRRDRAGHREERPSPACGCRRKRPGVRRGALGRHRLHAPRRRAAHAAGRHGGAARVRDRLPRPRCAGGEDLPHQAAAGVRAPRDGVRARARARNRPASPTSRRSTTRCWRSIASSRPGSPRRPSIARAATTSTR